MSFPECRSLWTVLFAITFFALTGVARAEEIHDEFSIEEACDAIVGVIADTETGGNISRLRGKTFDVSFGFHNIALKSSFENYMRQKIERQLAVAYKMQVAFGDPDYNIIVTVWGFDDDLQERSIASVWDWSRRKGEPPANSIRVRLKFLDADDIAGSLALPAEGPFDPKSGGPGSVEPSAVASTVSLTNVTRDTKFTKPQQFVDGNVVRAKRGGAFGIELLVNDRPVTPQVGGDGFAFVRFNEKDEYKVRLYNNSNYRVGVELLIDGVDRGWFSQAEGALRVIQPRSTSVVNGWKLDSRQAAAFEVVPAQNSVAASLNRTGSIGTVHANFYRFYNSEEEKREAFDMIMRAFSKIDTKFGTGRGRTIPAPTVTVRGVKGDTLRGAVSVRYRK
ncbi:hypothetical protein [Calycomorphotria hydatis]|uniref:Uncharacterized protein n=1 Tax=Calycomorphotria hydatis TaxID=2528027 RepID=A0A517TDW9_9PLAN|nr:hypothetical protein [Calycomorphotria hydatis]QDT66571.1 hypothetical protein V22_38410 [Calycomorphotria hydatis]